MNSVFDRRRVIPDFSVASEHTVLGLLVRETFHLQRGISESKRFSEQKKQKDRRWVDFKYHIVVAGFF